MASEVDTAMGRDLSVPEPGLTRRSMIARAEAMREALIERQAETERLTYYPLATHQEFLKAGFYRVLQPRRFGGYEFDPATFFKVVIELSRGCPSTGWCYCLASAHILQATGVFDEPALAEIIGADGEFRAASFGFEVGIIEPADGGYRVTGKWPYASGAPYATQYIGHTRLDGEPVAFALPRSEWRLCDDWGDAMGLKGSGSMSVQSDGGFIPKTHLIRGTLMQGRTDRAPRVADNPMYIGQMGAIGSAELAAVAVGAAKGALDEYERIITTRTATMQPQTLRVDLPDYQRYWGAASAKIAAAEAILMRFAAEYIEVCAANAAGERAFTVEDDMRLVLSVQEAGRLAFGAVEGILFRTGGSSAARDGQRLQRYFRDLCTYWSHNAPSSDDFFATQYARLRFGTASGPTQAAR